MSRATVTSSDTDVVADSTRKVRVGWVMIRNTGTASAAGVVQLRDATASNAVLLTFRIGSSYLATNDFSIFFPFPSDFPLESEAGLNVAFTATNIAVEIGYE